jgi:hypothetical protein
METQHAAHICARTCKDRFTSSVAGAPMQMRKIRTPEKWQSKSALENSHWSQLTSAHCAEAHVATQCNLATLWKARHGPLT